MRLNHKHELKNYLANKKIAIIQKAHQNIHMRIQLINNRLVDQKILEWNDETAFNIYDPYNEDVIASEITGYNKIATNQDVQRILQHSLVTRDPQTELEANIVIRNVTKDITSIEAERVVKNLNYIENVLGSTDVDIAKYNKLVEKLPASTSRREVLQRCIQTGEELPANRRLEWLERNLRRGASYNKQYTYKELNQLSRDLERYKTHRLDYETAIMENQQANREGYANVNESKTWVWSTLEKTRHEDMDGETVLLTEKFEVTNSQTGDVDYLLFPGDVTNDHNNCSNICNCDCTYYINNS